jgi:hypothetical protein
MVGSMHGTLFSVVQVGVLVAAAAGVQGFRETHYPALKETEEQLYITSGTALRRFTTGYNTLTADLYWIRTIQYYGGTKLALNAANGAAVQPASASGEGTNAYPLLYPLLDLTTSLDPRFNIAYRFGAIFLAEPYPGGAGRPDLALTLLEKGLRENATKWEYMQDIGFVHYWWRHDYRMAAEWFERASHLPGAPWWLKSLAANTLTEGGDRRSSRLMWEEIRRSAELDWLRSDAERRLTQLQALDQIDRLQAAVAQAQQRGVAPLEWTAIVRSGVLPGIPVDPSGTVYELVPNGRVQLSPKSPLYPLPLEPQRVMPLP